MLSCIEMAKCFEKENNVKMSYFYMKCKAIFFTRESVNFSPKQLWAKHYAKILLIKQKCNKC